MTAAMLTVWSELGWTAYLGGEGLWSAVPEGVFNIAANACSPSPSSAPVGRLAPPVGAAASWLVVLVAARAFGGPTALAALLGAAYAVQLTPAVVTAWRTWSPSGIAVSTWTLRLTEAVLWGLYGHVRGDLPLVLFGVFGTVESCAVLLRKHDDAAPSAGGRGPGASGSRHNRLTMRWWGRSVSVVRKPSPATAKPLAT